MVPSTCLVAFTTRHEIGGDSRGVVGAVRRYEPASSAQLQHSFKKLTNKKIKIYVVGSDFSMMVEIFAL